MYCVYILKCSDNTLYTGVTNNLEKRIKKHNGELVGGAKYTKSRRPVELVYSEACESKSQALKREIEIKKLKREQKLELVQIGKKFQQIEANFFAADKIRKYDLENVKYAYTKLGFTDTLGKIIHIAGTNGKGSTTKMCASILQEAGKTVGVYTSPHLVHIRQRFVHNKTIITPKEFVEIIEKIESFDLELSPFELTVIIALEFFRRKKVEYIVLEVGLGGRLDATNVVAPAITAITSISLDHQKILGNTLEQIAQEKAGIIKKNIPVVLASPNTEIESVASSKHAPVIFSRPKSTNLFGKYQEQNAGIAYEICKYLQIDEESVLKGLQKVEHKGRLDFLSENLLIDGAHNEDGLLKLKQFIESKKNCFSQVQLCVSLKKNKNVSMLLKDFGKVEQLVIVDYEQDMLESVAELQLQCDEQGIGYIVRKPAEIIATAKKEKNTLFVVFGSLYMIGSFYA